MSGSSQHYCLRWNNHRSNLLNVFDELLQNEAFTDVTLAVEGGTSIKCHRMVLAACSSYFQSLFIDLPCRHPIVVLKDVQYHEIKTILEYMYRGEVNVAYNQLNRLLRVADVLQVKGLVEDKLLRARQVDCDETLSSSPPMVGTSAMTVNAEDRPTSSPNSTGNSGYPTYGESSLDAGQGHLSLPLWALSALPIPTHQTVDQRATLLSVSYDNNYETSPVKRKRQSSHATDRDTPILRTVLGTSSLPDCSQSLPASDHQAFRSNGPHTDRERSNDAASLHGHYSDSHLPEEENKSTTQPTRESRSGGSGMTSGQKPNWKRYKQYTREDMMAAIEAVRSGMSTPKASRKYGVPSRTLYEKVNSLGIATSRPFKRGSNGTSSACFPYGIGGNVNGGIYNTRLSESESENSSATVETHPPPIPESTCKNVDPSMDHDAQSEDHVPDDPGDGDQVEDLSVNRKNDPRPTTSGVVVKEELPDVATDN